MQPNQQQPMQQPNWNAPAAPGAMKQFTQGKQAQQVMPFTQQHHQIYEQLRQALMGLHQQGIPGMDQILNALNQQHVKLAGQSGGAMNPQQVLQGQNIPQNFRQMHLGANIGAAPSNIASSQ